MIPESTMQACKEERQPVVLPTNDANEPHQ